jgi:hypothetical protein
MSKQKPQSTQPQKPAALWGLWHVDIREWVLAYDGGGALLAFTTESAAKTGQARQLDIKPHATIVVARLH